MLDDLNIAGMVVAAGQRITINIPVARLYTHTEMTLPVHVLRGRRQGPRLFVSAAIHGDEIVGVEIIRRLLELKILARLRGTLLAIPVVNVYGFVNNSRYSPDRRDLNRFFPGTERGSLTSRLANLFMEEIVGNSTHGIDLHTGSSHRTNFPHIRACLDDPETERLAFSFGAPVVVNADLQDGSLRQAVRNTGIPVLLYEAGEALRFDEVAIRTGVRGILSVMRATGMLPAKALKPPAIRPMVANSTIWVRAPVSGILRSRTVPGRRVEENDILGKIADPFGENEIEVSSPISGIVIGRLNLPLVHQGDALFHIAHFEDTGSIQETIEDFREGFPSDTFDVLQP